MEEESANTNVISGMVIGLAMVIGFFVGVLGSIYLYMYVLVDVMKYDYVTSSSIVFLIVMFGLVIMSIPQLLNIIRGNGSIGNFITFILLYAVLYPLFMSASFNLYEAWSKPIISDAVNAVAAYRHYIGLPFLFLIKSVSALGVLIGQLAPGTFVTEFATKSAPAMEKVIRTYSYIETSPLLSGVALLLIAQVFRKLLPNNNNNLPQNAMTAMAN